MKPRIWLNLALLLAVVGLASLLYFKPQSNAPSEYRLSTLQASDIQSITIDKPAGLNLEKRDHSWFITRPFVARADTFQVERLLEILSATSKQRFPANDLKRFDLDQPQARLTLGKQAFSFGALNPLTAEQYVATADNVYLVSPRYGAAAAAADKQVFAAPRDVIDHLTASQAWQICCHLPAQTGIADNNLRDAPPAQARLETAPRYFYFRKLWHGLNPVISALWTRRQTGQADVLPHLRENDRQSFHHRAAVSIAAAFAIHAAVRCRHCQA